MSNIKTNESSPLCRLDWGLRGAKTAVARDDVVVIVDVLSFSSTVITAVERGASVIPCLPGEDQEKLTRRTGGVIAQRRSEARKNDGISLSPVSMTSVEPDQVVLLSSPNGAICCRSSESAPLTLIGSFLNAVSVSKSVEHYCRKHETSVTVIACGERHEDYSDPNRFRFAVEDYLAAGAILSEINLLEGINLVAISWRADF